MRVPVTEVNNLSLQWLAVAINIGGSLYIPRAVMGIQLHTGHHSVEQDCTHIKLDRDDIKNDTERHNFQKWTTTFKVPVIAMVLHAFYYLCDHHQSIIVSSETVIAIRTRQTFYDTK